ncbi:unnamed protein product [Paramecium sonneborni]|uniref:Autophagy-related protein n=1 Tax=Paramecium sonneborni TaxID=65129 RepID=A0A8S1RH15_9CILI|nr:unnamed protein product [Paramecium sonneborni]
MLQKKLNLMGLVNDDLFEYSKIFNLEERKRKYENVIKHTGDQRILVVLEKHKKASIKNQNLKQAQYQLFAINKSKTLVEFMEYVKQNAGIDVSTSIFLYCNNQILMMKAEMTVGNIYDQFKNKEDQHLYIKYANFETFG